MGGTWEKPRHGMALGIARCFEYLHHGMEKSYIHRDLKPDNVLVCDKMCEGLVAKVADFGESREFDGSRASEDEMNEVTMTVVGTKAYLAPEVYFGGRYNKSVDVYSYAFVLME